MQMRNLCARLVLVTFGAALAVPALTAAEATITGELISAMCYAESPANRGAAHQECSLECVSEGQPVALLTADGTVYKITGALTADHNAKLAPHVSHQVALTGEVTEQDGVKTIAAVKVAPAE